MNVPETECDLLILVPTVFELSMLDLKPNRGRKVEICGFGPIGSGIGAYQKISQHVPKHVLLIGIAGSLHVHAQIGSAYTFKQVALDGVGADGEDELDLKQLPNVENSNVTDRLSMDSGNVFIQSHQQNCLFELLTVCQSTSDLSIVERRKAHFPEAVAEDMEGYSVALAAHALNVPLTIIRGISNIAGDRNKRNWQIREALSAARAMLIDEFS